MSKLQQQKEFSHLTDASRYCLLYHLAWLYQQALMGNFPVPDGIWAYTFDAYQYGVR